MKQIEKDLKLNNPSNQSNTVNLANESVEIEVGSVVEEEPSDYTTPLYIKMMIHGKLIHKCMLDSSASDNLMPKVIMGELVLENTNPYHDLYSFDSKPVKCIRMIKDLVVTLAKIP